MAEQILLPPLGQTSDEMAIVVWYKKEGDSVAIAEPLLCVETDKAEVDVESAEEGVLLRILAQPGESLPSGAVLGWIGQPGEAVPDDAAGDPSVEGTPPVAEPPIQIPSLVEERPHQRTSLETSAPATPADDATTRIQASPVVRKLAASLGVDLATVTGTGPGGRVERADVELAVTGAAAPAASTEVSSVRRAIARRLTKSVQTKPQFALQADLDASGAKALIAAAGIPGLTYTHVLLRAMASALRAHPAMARIWDDDGPAYRNLAAPDIGLAVAGDDALYVVTIEEPDRIPLPELVERVRAAAERGRAGVLVPDDQRAAAISLSNLGMFGVDSFTAIVDPDQTAIVAAGAVRDRVRPVDGAPAVVPELSVTLTVDHRAADGAQAARYLADLRAAFEHPAAP